MGVIDYIRKPIVILKVKIGIYMELLRIQQLMEDSL